MVKALMAASAAVLLLAGCATAGRAIAAKSETIRYETSPCFGACPVYTVTVSSDGTGRFEGTRFTKVTGVKTFTVTPAQFADFRDRLKPYRPNGEVLMNGPPLCKAMATDQISIDVKWTGPDKNSHLDLYYGCDMAQHRSMMDAVGTATQALPIADLIGKH